MSDHAYTWLKIPTDMDTFCLVGGKKWRGRGGGGGLDHILRKQNGLFTINEK